MKQKNEYKEKLMRMEFMLELVFFPSDIETEGNA